MINYSIAMLGNPAKKQDPKKAYGVAQYTEKMTLAEFSEHISSHGSTYDAEGERGVDSWQPLREPEGGCCLQLRGKPQRAGRS